MQDMSTYITRPSRTVENGVRIYSVNSGTRVVEVPIVVASKQVHSSSLSSGLNGVDSINLCGGGSVTLDEGFAAVICARDFED